MTEKDHKDASEIAAAEAEEEDYEEQIIVTAEESVITELENNDEEEIEDVEEEVVRRFRRCQRRKKTVAPLIRVFTEVHEGEEEELEDEEEKKDEVENEDEEEEDEEEDEESKEEERSVSEYESVYSAVPFEWENQIFEFIDLCDPGTMYYIYERKSEMISNDIYCQKYYLRLCDHVNVSPIIRFYNSLITSEADLSFHGLSPKQMYTVCKSLEKSKTVGILNLKNNPLTNGSCQLLSTLLKKNCFITVLDLSGCKIGPEGAFLLAEGLKINENLKELNLTKCYIEDEGIYYLAFPLKNHPLLGKLILSWNKLGADAAEAMGAIFYSNNTLYYLVLDYNNLFDPPFMKKFFKGLSVNTGITYLSLKWNALNSLEIGNALAQFLRKNNSIKYLDLSDNRLDGVSIKPLGKALSKNESLEILRLSRNPLIFEDAEYLLPGLRGCRSLKLIDLQEIWVRIEFIKSLNKIKQSKDIDVIYDGVYSNYKIYGPDYPAVILKRAQFEGMKPKKSKAKREFGNLLFMLGDEPVTVKFFMDKVKSFKAKINKELYPELIKQFIIPKVNLVNVVEMRKKYLSLFPDFVPTEKKRKIGKNKRDKKRKKDDKVSQLEDIGKSEPEIQKTERSTIGEVARTSQGGDHGKSDSGMNKIELNAVMVSNSTHLKNNRKSEPEVNDVEPSEMAEKIGE